MERLAQIVSVIFHPLLLTTYLLLIVGIWMPSLLLIRYEHLLTFMAFMFGVTFVLPVLNLFLFRQYGMIKSLRMQSRKERLFPFVFISVLYVLIACLFAYKLNLSVGITKLLVIIAALVVAATVTTFFLKVSIHSLSWAGMVGILLPLNTFADGRLMTPIAVLILIAGLVMSARLKLGAHTLREVMIGALMGIVIGLGGVNVLFWHF